jgi:hypothetical protein
MIAISQMRDCEGFEDDALEMLYCLSPVVANYGCG